MRRDTHLLSRLEVVRVKRVQAVLVDDAFGRRERVEEYSGRVLCNDVL